MHNIIPQYLSAYQKFYCCETSLLKLVSDTLWAIEQQIITAVLTMDLQAAFETVDHYLLLDVLQGKNQHHKHSTQVVQELPKTKKIHSLYQWLILIRTDDGLWLTPRIHSRHITI